MCRTSIIEMRSAILEAAAKLSSNLTFSTLSVCEAVNKRQGVYPGTEWVSGILSDAGYKSESGFIWKKS